MDSILLYSYVKSEISLCHKCASRVEPLLIQLGYNNLYLSIIGNIDEDIVVRNMRLGMGSISLAQLF